MEVVIDNCTNLTNGTIVDACQDEICVEDTIYRKVMGTIIFVMVWPFIVFDLKWFPLGRPAAALLGATFMVIFVIVPPSQVFEVVGAKGSLQAIFLLLGMMLLSYYYDREGLLRIVALWIFGKDKPFYHILWKICALTACMAAIITNDATSLVMTPLVLSEHIKQGRSRKELPPLLIGICSSANIGSAATFFGNPQNAFIAANSAGQVSLIVFFQSTLPAAILGTLISIGMLYAIFFREIFRSKPGDDAEKGVESAGELKNGDSSKAALPDVKIVEAGLDTTGRQTLAASREDLARSYDQSENPNLTSQQSHERDIMYGVPRSSSHLSIPRSRSQYSEQGDKKNVPQSTSQPNIHDYETHPEEFELRKVGGQEGQLEAQGTTKVEDVVETKGIFDRSWRELVFMGWLIFITVLVIILLAIPPPPTVSADFNLGLVPLGAGILTMLMDTIFNRKYPFDAIVKMDWAVVLMFMGLFTWLQGFENTGLPGQLFGAIRRYMNLNTFGGVLFFTVFVMIGSNILSNVPLTILIVEEIGKFLCTPSGAECPVNCSIRLVGVLLAWITTISGNFTLLGSVTNLIVAEKARAVSGKRLTFLQHLKYGLITTTIVLFSGLPVVYFLGKVARA